MAEINLTTASFDAEVKHSDIPVLVDFWATWCGPCRMMAPVVEEIAKEYEGKVKVCKVNVDEEEALAVSYHVSAIPTLLVFKNGAVTESSVGVTPKAKLLQMLGI